MREKTTQEISESAPDFFDRRSASGLMIASHVRIPIGKTTLGIFLPRPHMQFVKRRQSKAIWRIDELRQVSVHRRHCVAVFRFPVLRQHEELDTDEAKLTVAQ